MSNQYKHGDRVPSAVLCKRLSELADAVTKGPQAVAREFTMRIPAEMDRDADLVLSASAQRIIELEAALAQQQEEEPVSKNGLLPCPFCGADAHIAREHDEDGCRWVYVKCSKCRARTAGDWFSSTGDDCPNFYEGVRQQWNARHHSPAAQPVTMDDAIAAGDGTLHGAIDYWQQRALKAETAQPQVPEGYFLLNRDESNMAIWNAIRNIKFGNRDDDKLIVAELNKLGFVVCRRSAATEES